jgi:hypothetical protein
MQLCCLTNGEYGLRVYVEGANGAWRNTIKVNQGSTVLTHHPPSFSRRRRLGEGSVCHSRRRSARMAIVCGLANMPALQTALITSCAPRYSGSAAAFCPVSAFVSRTVDCSVQLPVPPGTAPFAVMHLR